MGEIGPIVQVQLGPLQKFWVITDADLFQEILQTKSKKFPRDRQIRDGNGIDEGNTVFNAQTYDEWRWRRRLLQPGFHRKELAKFAETMVEETEQLTRELEDGQTFNLTDLMKKLTMRIICQTMFSASLDETDILQEAFETGSEYSFRQMSAIVKTPIWLPTPLILRTRRAVFHKYDILGRIVDERLSSGQPKDDMLDTLIAAQLSQDEADEGMPGAGRAFDRDDLMAEMGSLVFAGHETTAMTLTWLFYVVATRDDIRSKLLAEIEAVLGDRLPTLADLDEMPYTQRLIQETLRFYPSVYVTLREAEEDDTLGTVDIPAGTQLIMNIRGLHRDPRYWPRPNDFDPERFLPENSADRHKFAYQPFISGPKKCIGDAFAMMEMRLVVPTLLQKIGFNLLSGVAQEAPGFVMETAEPVVVSVSVHQ